MSVALEIFETEILTLKRQMGTMADAIKDLAVELTKMNKRVEKLEYTQRVRKCNPFETK